MSETEQPDVVRAEYTVRSTRKAVSQAIELVADAVGRLAPDVDLAALRLVVMEASTNALLYGALGISSQLRETEGEEAFWSLVEERERQPAFGNLETRIQVRLFSDRLELRVRDPGSGFDWRKTEQAPLSESPLAAHGRGIFILRSYANDVEWNKSGNEIRLTLRRGGGESAKGGWKVELKVEKRGSATVVRVRGNLTIAAAQGFFARVIDLFEKGDRKVLIEASELEAIDSIGLGTVVRVSKRAREAGAKLRLANLRPSVAKVFQLTKLDKALDIYENEQQALSGF